MLPRRLFNRAFVTVFQQRIAFFVPFVADRRSKYAVATVLTGVTRICRSFAVFLFVRFLSVPQRAERRFRVFIGQTAQEGVPFGICFLLSTQALVCVAPASGRRRSSFLTVSLVVRSLGVLAALFFRGVFYPPCVFVCGIKKVHINLSKRYAASVLF